LIAAVGLAWPVLARGQIIGIECCATDADFQRIGLCMSGPGNEERPEGCPTAGICVIGYAHDGACGPQQTPPDDFGRGLCSSWRVGDDEPVARCVAPPTIGIDLFSLYDHDVEVYPIRVLTEPDQPADGDVDLMDFSVFQNIYPIFPNAVQPKANPFVAECCLAEDGLRRLGNCLSGPGIDTQPAGCESHLSCVIGFDAPVGPGDEMFQLCRAGEPLPPKTGLETCVGIEDTPFVPAFECQAAPLPGVDTFSTFDGDADGDFDLADYARYQYSLAVPTP
jgi:hypothetical protein